MSDEKVAPVEATVTIIGADSVVSGEETLTVGPAGPTSEDLHSTTTVDPTPTVEQAPPISSARTAQVSPVDFMMTLMTGLDMSVMTNLFQSLGNFGSPPQRIPTDNPVTMVEKNETDYVGSLLTTVRGEMRDDRSQNSGNVSRSAVVEKALKDTREQLDKELSERNAMVTSVVKIVESLISSFQPSLNPQPDPVPFDD